MVLVLVAFSSLTWVMTVVSLVVVTVLVLGASKIKIFFWMVNLPEVS